MRVIGHSLTACLLVQALLEREVAVVWYASNQSSFATLLPDLTLLPGPTLGLAQVSRALWRRAASLNPLPLLAKAPLADLATTPGRVAKLHEEALLDTLAGEPTSYLETPPLGLQPKLVQGVRWQAEAPLLAAGLHESLLQSLAQKGQRPQPLPTNLSLAWLEAELTTLTDMALAAQLIPALGLKPRRSHCLSWSLTEPLPLPEAPLQLLHRMPKGHAWFQLTTTNLHLWYDGLADPRQANASPDADQATVAALAQHGQQLLPLLARPDIAPPSASAWVEWLMPDSLPLVGPLTPDSAVWLLGGMGVRAGLYAPALIERVMELWDLEEYQAGPYAPQRMAEVALAVPESLDFPERPPTSVADTSKAAAVETRGNVTDVAPPEVKRATEVRMVSKEVTGQSQTPRVTGGNKPKIQMASVKKT